MDAKHVRLNVLIVSQDPGFILEAQREVRRLGGTARGCLGPAHSTCVLETDPVCPLAGHSTVVLVDSPPSGVFAHRSKMIPVGMYASELRRLHPQPQVILCGAPIGPAGYSGEVMHIEERAVALRLIELLADKDGQTAKEPARV